MATKSAGGGSFGASFTFSRKSGGGITIGSSSANVTVISWESVRPGAEADWCSAILFAERRIDFFSGYEI